MILPDKYVSIENSYIGLSAFIIDLIKEKEYTIDSLWEEFKKKYNKSSQLKLRVSPTFQKFLSVLNFMFAIGLFNYKTHDNGSGVVYNENFKP